MATLRRFTSYVGLALHAIVIVMVAVSVYLLWSTFRLNAVEHPVEINQLATLGRIVSAYDDQVKLAASGEVEGLLQVQRQFVQLDESISTLLDQSLDAPLRQNAAFEECLQFLGRFIEETRPIMAQDRALRAELSNLETSLKDIRFATDKLLLAGFEVLEIEDEAWHARVTSQLMAFAVLVTVGILVYLAFVAVMRRQRAAIRGSNRAKREANQRLSATIDASLDAVIVADMHGIILDYNGAAEQIFGYVRDEVLGLNLSELIIPPHLRTAHKAGMKRFRETAEPKLVGQGAVSITAIRKDGTEFPVELVFSKADAADGPIMISYIRDMTAAKTAEAALQEARDAALAADQAKSRFLAIMSHEMRTPLTGIFGAFELIQKTKLSEKQGEYFDLAQTGAKTLLRHVNDVLDISRIDSGQLDLGTDAIDLKALLKELQQTYSPVAKESGNRILTLSEGVKSPIIVGDNHRIRQILLNLLTNALKFTEDGLVTLSVREEENLGDKSNYIFMVEDTGAGIPTEHQPHIFEEFYTQDQSYSRTNQGTGLGLSIVRRLIGLMGGEIDFSSEPGKGAKFWFNLILPHGDAADLPDQDEKQPEIEKDGMRVLLVEDNSTSRLVVSALLRDMGLEVYEAENGAEAVTQAHDVPLDAILMDISMPVMDGLEATAKIQSGSGPNKTTPIIALTAHALPHEQQAFLDAGMVTCLTKPVDPSLMVKTLNKYLGSNLKGKGMNNSLNEGTVKDLKGALGEALFEKTIQSFLAETAEAFEVMRSGQDAGELDAIQREAHKTLGAAGLLGADDLKTKLRAVEQAAKGGHASEIPGAMAEAEQAWDLVKADLGSV